MKILNILVNHTVEPLRSHMVRYLLDAGHFVYLIGLSDAERTRWTGSQHNLFCYSDVGDQRIDYELCLEESASVRGPIVRLAVFADRQNVLFQIHAEEDGNIRALAQRELHWWKPAERCRRRCWASCSSMAWSCSAVRRKI